MNRDPQEIEVEVVEVDDSTEIRSFRDDSKHSIPQGRPFGGRAMWEGRVRTLNLRWWPIWSLMALLALIPLLLLALIVGFFLLCLRLVSLLWRGLGLGGRR